MEPPTPKGSRKESRTEFTTSKPLPPIGSVEGQEDDDDGRQSEGTKSLDREDAGSSLSQSSTAAFDRPGEGSARPRIIRGFRPEVFSDDDDDLDDGKLVRRVSFTEVKERMFKGKSEEPRETIKRKTYDGREITFVTLDTQTDWDWVSDVEAGTARTQDSEKSTADEKSKTKTVQKTDTVDESPRVEDQVTKEGSTFQMPYNDEYGIPILDLSSDTDDSSDEEFMVKKKIKDERNFIPSVGPPQILQYQRESEKQDIGVEDPESRLPKSEPQSEDELEKDEQGLTHGMFSGSCEFCKKPVKPFPTLEQQLQLPPEELYCCNDYREFVEYVLMTTQEMEEEQKKKNKLISVKVHDHVGSKQERNAAKEKAVQRMRERELQRRAQEASGLQQNFFASMQMAGAGGLASGYKAFVKHSPFTMKDVYAEHSVTEPHVRVSGSVSGSSYVGVSRAASNLVGAPHPLVDTLHPLVGARHSQGVAGSHLIGLSQAVSAGVSVAGQPPKSPLGEEPSTLGLASQYLIQKEVDLSSVNPECVSDCLVARKKHIWDKVGMADGVGAGKHSEYCNKYRLAQYASVFLGCLKRRVQVARQMKTINYQLSSQKCLEEGWTLRAPSPLLDDLGDNVFEPEPLDPALIAEGRLRERPLIEKFYETGQKFLTMFPDGTGNVFYPSGNLAILITSVKLGQFQYTIHQDVARSGVAAAFDPNGYGYCYFPNGEIRLYIDQYGGLELDDKGGKKRKWQWKDHVTHVHAPPFQPICIALNRHMAVRVMSQENIAATFSAHQRSCRFNMGSKLKLVAPENVPLKEIEENYIFLEEKKNYVGTLLDKVSTLLRFPNSPKIDKILPPIHVTNKITKTERLKQQRKSLLAQQSARDKKQSAISVN